MVLLPQAEGLPPGEYRWDDLHLGYPDQRWFNFFMYSYNSAELNVDDDSGAEVDLSLQPNFPGAELMIDDGTTITFYSFYNRQIKLTDKGTIAKPSNDSYEIQLYTYSGELYVKDTSGNETLLSPHRFELFTPDLSYEFPWSYYSENEFIGKKINVDMYGAIHEIERLSGKKFIYTEDIQKTDWDENEDRLIRESEEALERFLQQDDKNRCKFPPKIHERQEMPQWLKKLS